MSDFATSPLRSIDHVAALCDLSPAAVNAVWRAGLVARDLAVPLKVLYPQPRAGQRSVAPAPPASLVSLREDVVQKLGPTVTLQPVPGDTLTEAVARSRRGLLVIPSGHGNPIRERLMGTQAERLIRLSRGPVLVVKQSARAAYRRVFVASDLQEGSAQLVGAGASLCRGAEMAVFHALPPGQEPAMRELDVPPAVVREYRMMRSARARDAIEKLATVQGDAGASMEHSRPSLNPVVVVGGAARMIQSAAQASRAELLVIGKRRRGLLADFLLGSVTQRVLATAHSDVLVVPLPQPHSTQAIRRLRAMITPPQAAPVQAPLRVDARSGRTRSPAR